MLNPVLIANSCSNIPSPFPESPFSKRFHPSERSANAEPLKTTQYKVLHIYTTK